MEWELEVLGPVQELPWQHWNSLLWEDQEHQLPQEFLTEGEETPLPKTQGTLRRGEYFFSFLDYNASTVLFSNHPFTLQHLPRFDQ